MRAVVGTMPTLSNINCRNRCPHCDASYHRVSVSTPFHYLRSVAHSDSTSPRPLDILHSSSFSNTGCVLLLSLVGLQSFTRDISTQALYSFKSRYKNTWLWSPVQLRYVHGSPFTFTMCKLGIIWCLIPWLCVCPSMAPHPNNTFLRCQLSQHYVALSEIYRDCSGYIGLSTFPCVCNHDVIQWSWGR